MNKNYISPNWHAPHNIKAVTTTRLGGVSKHNYSSFNLSETVGDHLDNVIHNRNRLIKKLNLPSEPLWLQQVHGNKIISHKDYKKDIQADAIIVNEKYVVCAILTADCLPIIICDQNATQIAAIHAGWQGLLNGIIAKTIKSLNIPIHELIAWIGPGITKEAYKVQSTMYNMFMKQNILYKQCFALNNTNEYFADLKKIAKLQLETIGIKNIYISKYCTFNDNQYFYSFRKENVTGRMATLIWIT